MVFYRGGDLSPLVGGLVLWLSQTLRRRGRGETSHGHWKRSIRKPCMNAKAAVGKRTNSLCIILHPSLFFLFPSHGLYFQCPWDPLGRTSPCLSLLHFASNISAYSSAWGKTPVPSHLETSYISADTALWLSRASTKHLKVIFFRPLSLSLLTHSLSSIWSS